MLHNKSEYYELPIKYDETVVRLLVQSPKRMYAYWDVSKETMSNFSKKHFDFCNSKPVLRVINVTKNYYYDIDIDPYSNNYYIDIKDENCVYKVELGRIYNNEFADIYVSNAVTVPPSHPNLESAEEDVLFKNYIYLDSRKIKVKRPRYGFKQDYGELPFGIDDNISSLNNLK